MRASLLPRPDRLRQPPGSRPRRRLTRRLVAVGAGAAIACLAIPLTATEAGASFTAITSGDLILSLYSAHQVNEYTPTGAFVQTLITTPSDAPTGSAFDGTGNLYVTTFGNNRILKVTHTSGAVSVFSSNTTLGDGTVYNSPESIAFGPGYTKMYVSDANRFGTGGGIHVVTPATGADTAFYALPTSNGSAGAGESDWLAESPTATLYMTNENPTQGVMAVDQTTGNIVTPSFVPTLPNFGYAMSFLPNGNMWVSVTTSVSEYSSAGTLLKTIVNATFVLAFASVFNPTFTRFYVANNSATGKVLTYNVTGTLLHTFGVTTTVTGIAVAGTVIVPPTTTTLTAHAASGDYHDPTTVSATLTTSKTGGPVAGQTVVFTLNGTSGQTCTGTTDATGVATCSITPDEAAGTYTLKATFAGSTGLVASSGTATFTVTLEQTSLAYTGTTSVVNGHAVTLSAKLTTDDPSAGTALATRTVTFTLGSGGGAQTCSGTTNSSGVASCSISSVSQPVGTVGVQATFAGDAWYLPASATGTVSVFAPKAVGAFVIGDLSAASSSATQYFWGAQWSKSNHLSGGMAPSSMKGFADSPTSMTCGGTWTSRTGNSSAPPATLTSTIEVIVSSEVTQKGSVLSGTIVHIVMVKVSKYGPAPGHVGTGTIVSEVC